MIRLRAASLLAPVFLLLACGASTGPSLPMPATPGANAGADAPAPPTAPRAARPFVVPQTAYEHSIYSLAFSADGRLLLTGGDYGLPRVWDVETGALRARYPREMQMDALLGVFFGPGERTVAGVSYGKVYLWDAVAGAILQRLDVRPSTPRAAAATADGALLAVGTDTAIVGIDLATGTQRFSTPTGHGRVLALAVAPDGSTIAAAHADGAVTLVDGAGKPGPALEPPPAPEKHAHGIGLSPDGKTLVVVKSGAGFGAIHVYALGAGGKRVDLQGPQGSVGTRSFHAVAWAPDGAAFAVASSEHVAVVDARTRDLKTIDAKDPDAVFFAGSSTRILVCHERMSVVDLATGERKDLTDRRSDHACAISPDGRVAASTQFYRTMLYDTTTGAKLREAAGDDTREEIEETAWGADGATFTSREGRTFRHRVWDPKKGVIESGAARDISAKLRPDGLELETLGPGGSVEIRDLSTGSVRLTIPKLADRWVFGWDPTGAALVMREPGGLVVRDARTGGVLLEMPAAGWPVVWSPSGGVVAATYGGGTKLWDVRTKKALGAFKDIVLASDVNESKVLWSDDESVLLVLPRDGLPALVDVRAGVKRVTMGRMLDHPAFVPGSTDFVTQTEEGITVVDGRTGRTRDRIAGTEKCGGPIVWSANGLMATTCGGSIVVRGKPGEVGLVARPITDLKALAFSRGGEAIAALREIPRWESSVQVWRTGKDAPGTLIDDPQDYVASMKWSPRGAVLLVGTAHGIRLLRAQDDTVLELRTFHDAAGRMTWIAHTWEGLFDGDREAAERVVVRLGDDRFRAPLARLSDLEGKLRRAGLLADFLAGKPIERAGEVPLP